MKLFSRSSGETRGSLFSARAGRVVMVLSIVSGAAAIGLLPATSVGASASSSLNAVSSIDNTHIWAVGADCTVLFSNGTTWTADSSVPAGCTSGDTNLTGVDVIDPTDGWIVGAGGTILVCSTGCDTATATWSAATSGTTDNLTAVTAAKNGSNYYAYAVGASDTVLACTANTTDTCATNTGTWTGVAPTTGAFSSASFTGVSTPANDGIDVWAVGSNTSGGFAAECVGNANCATANTNWAQITSIPTTSTWNAVSAQANNLVYVVGTGNTVEGCIASCNTTTPTWNGQLPGNEGTDFTAVSVQGGGNAWAVGSDGTVVYTNNPNNATPTWTLEPIFANASNSGALTANLNGVFGKDPMHAWAVGASGTVIFTGGTNGQFEPQSSGTSQALNAVSAIDNTHIWAVGANCTVLFSGGTTWTADSSVPAGCTSGDTNLTGVDVIDPTDGWIVGANGTILVCSTACNTATATWSAATSGTTDNLTAVTAAKGAGNTFYAYAVGASDTVQACTATTVDACATTLGTWASVAPTTGAFSSASFTGVSTPANDGIDVWAVGSNTSGGFAAECVGSATCATASTDWAQITSIPTTSAYNAVSAQGNNLVYVVGSGNTIEGCIASCNTTTPTWTADASGLSGSTNLTGVSLQGPGNAWVVGSDGAISFSMNPNNATPTWTEEFIFASAANAGELTVNLNGVWGMDPMHAWAVGAGGAVIFTGGTNGQYEPQITGAGGSTGGSGPPVPGSSATPQWGSVTSFVVPQPNGAPSEFVMGAGGSLWNYWYASGTWDSYEITSSGVASAPVAVLQSNGSPSVFYEGTGGSLWNRWYVSGTWFSHEITSGGAASAPAAVLQTNGAPTLVVQGPSNSILNYWYIPSPGIWGAGTVAKAGSAFSAPAVITQVNAAGAPSVFVQGPGNSLLNYWYIPSPGIWGAGTVAKAGSAYSDPAVVGQTNAAPSVFVQGPGNSILNYWYIPSPGTWGAGTVAKQGSAFSDFGVAIQPANGGPSLFVQGPGNSMLNFWYIPSPGTWGAGTVAKAGTAFSAPGVTTQPNGGPSVFFHGPGTSLLNYWYIPSPGIWGAGTVAS